MCGKGGGEGGSAARSSIVRPDPFPHPLDVAMRRFYEHDARKRVLRVTIANSAVLTILKGQRAQSA